MIKSKKGAVTIKATASELIVDFICILKSITENEIFDMYKLIDDFKNGKFED